MNAGVVVEGRGGFYRVLDDGGQTYTLRAMKKLRRAAGALLVGDRVLFTPGLGEEHGWVEEILPRKNTLVRPPAANVDILCVVLSPAPAPDWLLMDKLLLSARRLGIRCVVAANKGDLSRDALCFAKKTYRGAEVSVIGVSAETGEGLEELRGALQGGLCCFTGQSGVGKSTLLSRLVGVALETGGISEKILRGKQTTRHATLLYGGGLRVLDTPGFSLFDTPDSMPPEELTALYPEFSPYEGKCRFSPCFHDREPGCAVARAADNGDIDGDRLQRYRETLRAVREKWKERYAK